MAVVITAFAMFMGHFLTPIVFGQDSPTDGAQLAVKSVAFIGVLTLWFWKPWQQSGQSDD